MSRLDDPERLDALAATTLMDSLPELDFDRITRLICKMLKVDVSLVSLVDASRQFFKSSHGLKEHVRNCTGTPLTHSFCQYVVITEQSLIVSDARHHPLLKDNLAIRDLNVIAYLGVPLRTPDRQIIGSVCAISSSPRDWTEEDQDALTDFAGIVENAIALRVQKTKAVDLADKNKILASEYNHRAKNLLAVIKSLLNLSAREAETRDGLIATFSGRLDAYGLAYDALAAPSGSFDLEALLRQLLMPYKHAGTAIIVPGPSLQLNREQVTPVCLIIHELATNSVKYGALMELALPSVSWAFVEDGRAVVTWDEPLPRSTSGDPPQMGFGTKLLAVAARQLGGEISRSWSGERLTVSFAIAAMPTRAS